MWGSNFAESNPIGWPAVRRLVAEGQLKLIVIDPRRTRSAEIATLHLAPRPRTDGALALGLIRVLIEEGLYDKAFVEQWCLGFEEVRAEVAEWTPERTSEITDVPAELIVAAARMYARALAGPYLLRRVDQPDRRGCGAICAARPGDPAVHQRQSRRTGR